MGKGAISKKGKAKQVDETKPKPQADVAKPPAGSAKKAEEFTVTSAVENEEVATLVESHRGGATGASGLMPSAPTPEEGANLGAWGQGTWGQDTGSNWDLPQSQLINEPPISYSPAPIPFNNATSGNITENRISVSMAISGGQGHDGFESMNDHHDGDHGQSWEIPTTSQTATTTAAPSAFTSPAVKPMNLAPAATALAEHMSKPLKSTSASQAARQLAARTGGSHDRDSIWSATHHAAERGIFTPQVPPGHPLKTGKGPSHSPNTPTTRATPLHQLNTQPAWMRWGNPHTQPKPQLQPAKPPPTHRKGVASWQNWSTPAPMRYGPPSDESSDDEDWEEGEDDWGNQGWGRAGATSNRGHGDNWSQGGGHRGRSGARGQNAGNWGNEGGGGGWGQGGRAVHEFQQQQGRRSRSGAEWDQSTSKVNFTSSEDAVGSRNVVSPHQRSQILNELLNATNEQKTQKQKQHDPSDPGVWGAEDGWGMHDGGQKPKKKQGHDRLGWGVWGVGGDQGVKRSKKEQDKGGWDAENDGWGDQGDKHSKKKQQEQGAWGGWGGGDEGWGDQGGGKKSKKKHEQDQGVLGAGDDDGWGTQQGGGGGKKSKKKQEQDQEAWGSWGAEDDGWGAQGGTGGQKSEKQGQDQGDWGAWEVADGGRTSQSGNKKSNKKQDRDQGHWSAREGSQEGNKKQKKKQEQVRGTWGDNSWGENDQTSAGDWNAGDGWGTSGGQEEQHGNWGDNGWGSQEQGGKKSKKEVDQQASSQWGGGWGDNNGWGAQDEGHSDDKDNDNEHRVRFVAGGSSLWGSQADTSHSMPSKTMVHTSKGAASSIHSSLPRNSINEQANIQFLESKGVAFQPAANAFFGSNRFARERLHWMFPPNKDERVSAMLTCIQSVAYGLGALGLHKFLQGRERGALFTNAAFRLEGHPKQPVFDWLTFDQLQPTMDKTLQESVAFYDPAVLVIVFIYLPSQTGNSVAIWRRKIDVPHNVRLMLQNEINIAKAGLRKEKDYVVHVDEIPKKRPQAKSYQLSKPHVVSRQPHVLAKKANPGPQNKPLPKPQKKRKWWHFFKSS